MADIIRALTDAVDKIGLLAVLIICVVVAATYIVMWNRRLIESMQNFSASTIAANTAAMVDNTNSNKLVAAKLDNLSNQMPALCKVQEFRKP